ncbi:MAG: substrate-binding domain-containing protein, partial [Sulfuricella sp.]
MRIRILSSLLLAAVTGFSVTALAETLEISGSTTVQKSVIEPNLGAIKAATGLEVKFAGVGTGKGMIALFEGKVPVAAASESLEAAVSSAKKAAEESGKAVSAPADLQFHEIKVDSIVVIVNKDNPVDALTKAQLKDINSGKVKNWKEVGGPDLPVKVVTSQPGSATRAVFQKQIMDGAD